ncbi:RNA-binding protein YlmH, contains S4-like domain [Natronincola peptidivorans]|uniref:RNA-binding protein YlmH, contains S4-like domain n=1 Tax=Natronincola peptidivorans TaxID=426128 RepID=A0A1H9Y9P6_9FIRM|nr:YlmH/Sll1252 family protein [Natronincola peptidivorans]SES65658.1 RNA-binding protein YlmH, contains S4-like domain [Natronincola peptidivorans]
MIDKELYLQHVKDADLKHLLVKALDKTENVLRTHDIKTTDFLNPYEEKAITNVLATFENINWIVTGGYQEAERKIIIIFQDYLSVDDIKIPLTAVEITRNLQSKDLNHRDYLGSILSLGIKREKIGDIIINGNICQVVIQEDLKDYVVYNLDKVGNTSITVREINLKDIKPLIISYKDLCGTVASLRLDSIVSLGFKTSRTEAQALIAKERVYINWGIANKNFHELHTGDIISVRGKGRIIVDEIQGNTKSGRIHVKLKKPI